MGLKQIIRTPFAVNPRLGLNEPMSQSAVYSVETSSPQALILGDSSPLVSAFSALLKKAHLQVSLVSTVNFSPSSLPPLADFDYFVTFADSDIVTWFSTHPGQAFWSQLLSLSRSDLRVLLVSPLSLFSQLPALTLPLRLALYGEYFSSHSSLAPTLENFLIEARDSHSLTIPGDGLQEYHLLHLEDLLTGLEKLLFAPTCSLPTYFLNPTSLSLLSLAYRLRSSLPHKTAILFDESQAYSPDRLPWEEVLESQAQISWSPEKNLELELPTFLKYFLSHPHHKSPTATLPPTVKPSSPPPAQALKPSSPAQRGDNSFAKISLQPSPSRRPHLQPLATVLARFRQPSPSPVFVPQIKGLRLKKSRASHSPSLHPVRRLVFRSLLIALALYFISLVIAFLTSYLSVRSLGKKLASANFNYSPNLAVARPSTLYLEANLFVLRSLPGFHSLVWLSDLNSLVLSLHQGLDVLNLATPLINTSQTLFSAIFSDQPIDLSSTLSLARLQVDSLYQALALFDGSLSASPPTLLPARIATQYLTLKTALQSAKHQILVAKTLFQIAPDLLGVGDRRQYALLFQNNMELRATGGFIGSFGLASFEDGKLYDFPIYDVYTADGQLKGHVEPPAPIKKYLGEANWYLRDSNWDPDFPTSARRAEWFLDKTLGTSVEGVIAINLATLQDILHALGPVTLPDYNEDINEENLFARAEYYAEINFFPGSTQKKEFLSSVASSLLTKLPSLSRNQSLALTFALLKSIDQKNTLISLSDPNLNATFSLLGWNGELRDPPCPFLENNTCFNDYAMLVDSNFGVNKANFFLNRQLDLKITIDQARLIKHHLTTTYTNTATSAAWPAGPYKNYSRLYLPSGSVLASLSLDGQRLSPQDITITSEHDRLIIGFLVEVPISTSVVVDVEYQVGILSENSPTYSFYWQKQSGTTPDPLTIYLNYPSFLTPGIVSPAATLNSQQLQFNLVNSTDRRITVQF